jgi:C-terminal processing protease CtpA/Prc
MPMGDRGQAWCPRALVEAAAAAGVVGMIALAATLALTGNLGFTPRDATREEVDIELDAKLGATVAPLDGETARSLGIEPRRPALVVTSLRDNGPAQRARIRAGDVIDSIGGTPVRTPSQAVAALKRSPTPHIAVTLGRRGRFAVVRLTIPAAGERLDVVEQGARR